MMARQLAVMATLVCIVALAIGASTASSGANTQSRFGTPTTNGSQQQVGSLVVKLTVTKSIRRHPRLYAVGAAIAQFKPTAENPQNLPTKAVRTPFTARVLSVRR